jgi:hypothetical protein
LENDDCGVCNGDNADKDDCGVCNGNNADKDDCGVCNGNNADKDDCGVCNGSGIASGACDCDGNVLDECGNCGGDGSSCATVGCPALTPDTVYAIVGESTLERWFSVGGVYDFGQCAIADFADGESCVLSCHPGYTPNPVFCDAKEGGWVIPEDGCIAIADDEEKGCPALTIKNADSFISMDVLQEWFGGRTVEGFGECGIADSSVGGSCVLECTEGFKPSAPLHCGEEGWVVNDAGCEPDMEYHYDYDDDVFGSGCAGMSFDTLPYPVLESLFGRKFVMAFDECAVSKLVGEECAFTCQPGFIPAQSAKCLPDGWEFPDMPCVADK